MTWTLKQRAQLFYAKHCPDTMIICSNWFWNPIMQEKVICNIRDMNIFQVSTVTFPMGDNLLIAISPNMTKCWNWQHIFEKGHVDCAYLYYKESHGHITGKAMFFVCFFLPITESYSWCDISKGVTTAFPVFYQTVNVHVIIAVQQYL